VVAGRGTQRDALVEQARRLRVSRSVEFTGGLEEEDLRALVAAADVAVVPSVYEPFGLVALETAALGTPLVVAGTGGLAEVVRDHESGLVVPPLDSAALADAVTELLRDEVLAHRVARAAREVVVRDHDWSALAARTVEVYAAAVTQEDELREQSRPAPVLRMAVRDGNLLRDDA
jgi:glycogen(starch) synthase